MSPLRLTGSTSGFSQLDAPAIAGDQTFTLPSTGGTLDRLNRAGNILQVVNATYSTQVSNSTNTYADTGLTATITPASSSNKILVIVNQAGCGKDTSNTALLLRLLRGATSIAVFETTAAATNSSAVNLIGACSICYIDSPATTSATTYKTQLRGDANAAAVYVQYASSISTITLMEVAA